MTQRKQLMLALAALGIALGTPAANAGDLDLTFGGLTISLNSSPPPPRWEPVPPPRHGHVWAPGYWHWQGNHHEWTKGHWLEARANQRWVPDRWVPAGHQWRYDAGHWEQAEVTRTSHRHHDESRRW